jgi:serine/threonine protein kinase
MYKYFSSEVRTHYLVAQVVSSTIDVMGHSPGGHVSFAPHQPYAMAVQVCLGLIKGVAHLHEFCIAHRDIKPENLVVDRDFCLEIIDFDVAMQVNDEDEVVNAGRRVG